MSSQWEKKISKRHPGQVFYYNTETHESSWVRPVDFNDNVCVVRPRRPVVEPTAEPSKMADGAPLKKKGGSEGFIKKSGLFEKIIGKPNVVPSIAHKDIDPSLKLRSSYISDVRGQSCSKMVTYDEDSRGSETNNLLKLTTSYSSLLTTNTKPKTAISSQTSKVSKVKSKRSPDSSKSSAISDSRKGKCLKRPLNANINQFSSKSDTHISKILAQVDTSVSSVSVPRISSAVSDTASTRYARIQSWLSQLPFPVPEKPTFSGFPEEYMEVDERVTTDITVLRNASDRLQNAGESILGVLLNQEMEWEPPVISPYQKELYLVLDTNIFLHSLTTVNTIMEELIVPEYSRPFLVIPWVVIQELDGLKGSHCKNIALKTELLAIGAVKYINDLLRSKHPRLICQKPQEVDVTLPSDAVNDDKILSCTNSLQKNRPLAEVILLSQDANLQNKGLIMGLDVLSLQSFSQWVNGKYPKTEPSSSTSDPGPVVKKRRRSDNSSSVDSDTKRKEAQLSDDILLISRMCLKESLSALLKETMVATYQEIWLEIVFRKPPWSLMDALLCFEKHWVAVYRFMYSTTHHKQLKEFILAMRQNDRSRIFHGNVRKASIMLKSGMEILRLFCKGAKLDKDLHNLASANLQEVIDISDAFMLKKKTFEDCVTAVQRVMQKVIKSPPEVVQAFDDGTMIESASVVQTCPRMQDVDLDGDAVIYQEDNSVEVVNQVKGAFQTCWDIMYMTLQNLEDHLSEDIQQSGVQRRQEAVFDFRNLMQYYSPLKNTYTAMMREKDLAPESEVLQALASSLNDLGVKFGCTKLWQNVTGPQLFVYQLDQRVTLEGGLSQMENDLEPRLSSLFFNKLLPSEQTVVNEGNT